MTSDLILLARAAGVRPEIESDDDWRRWRRDAARALDELEAARVTRGDRDNGPGAAPERPSPDLSPNPGGLGWVACAKASETLTHQGETVGES